MDDLISEFITETSESLALLDQELIKLEQNPNDSGILGNIFRLVHTIKGTCGFLGLPRLESVAHAGENVLGKIRDGAIIVSPQAITLVLAALDTIKLIMDYLAEHGEEPAGDDKPLIAKLNHFADTNGAVDVAAAPVAPAEKPAPKAEPKADINVVNMLSVDEIKVGGGTVTASEMEALEKAFREASATVEGGYDFSAPVMQFDENGLPILGGDTAVPQEKTALPVAPQPMVKKDISEAAKNTAIKQGLEADSKEGAGLANQSIRVNIEVLENLMQMVGELVLTRNQLMQIVRNRDDKDFKAPLQTLSQITTELQESVMKTRMQPIGNAWSKFPRLIRDLSSDLGKKIDLKMIGADTELDRQLLEMIKDPLTHMVRNSCDHGLEMPADRVAAGKSDTGSVTLSAYHEGGHIIIEIADDGRGLNMVRIKQKILDNGLADEDELAALSDEQIMQYIFKPGFSTAEKVTSVSGRGVGMDVVRTNIEKIGGTVELSSVYGKGSTFSIKIPLTLAIVSVLIVDAAGERFAIPQINVLELVKAGDHSDYHIEALNETRVLRLRDKLLPLIRLSDVLQLTQSKDHVVGEDAYIAVVKVGVSSFGLIVDRIYDTEEIVVKPVSTILKDVPLYSGNTILGDGSVIMILDPNGLVRQLGDVDLGGKTEDADAKRKTGQEDMVTFLVFRSGVGSPKAVPLELVSRLEEIDVAMIEHSDNTPVVQYRGDLMRLKTLPSNEVPSAGMCPVVVFTYDNHTVGMVVDEICDIVEAPLNVKLTSDTDVYIGSMVIEGKTTDIMNVSYMLKDIMHDTIAATNVNGLTGKRLLYIEDSLFFRNLTVPYLSSFGLEVTQASGPVQALEILKKSGQIFDVIVTDIEMPDMDGIELSKLIRSQEKYYLTPLYAFTSTINEQLIKRANDAGINAVVQKTNRDTLITEITESLALRKEAA